MALRYQGVINEVIRRGLIQLKEMGMDLSVLFEEC
jgi:hypothetical protein